MKSFIALCLLVLLIGPELTKASSSEANIDNWLQQHQKTKRTKRPKTTRSAHTTTLTTASTIATRTPSTPETTRTTEVTSAPTPTCLPGETSITIDDLKFLLEDGAKGKAEYFKKLNETFAKEAKEVHDKYMMEFNDFIKLATDKPKHLMHVLKYVTHSQQAVQKLIKELNEAVEKHADIFKDIKEVEKEGAELQKSFSICEQVCENSLKQSPTELPKSETQTIKELEESLTKFVDVKIYCGKIPDITHRIASSIEFNLNKTESEGRQLIKNYGENIDQNLKAFKIKFKNLAFKEFDGTVYDVMSVLDEYHHLKGDVDQIHSHIREIIRDLKRNISYVRSDIDKTKQEIQKIQEKCVSSYLRHPESIESYWNHYIMNVEKDSSSSRDIVPLSPSSDEDYSDDQLWPEPDEDLLEVLLEENNNNTNFGILISIESVFEDITEVLNDDPSKYVDDLKPTQREVEELIKKEYNMFEELKKSFPAKKIADLKAMPETINKIKNQLDEIAEKLKKM